MRRRASEAFSSFPPPDSMAASAISWRRTRCAAGRSGPHRHRYCAEIAGGRHAALGVPASETPRRDCRSPMGSSHRFCRPRRRRGLFPNHWERRTSSELPLTETILMARHMHVGEIHNYMNGGSAPRSSRSHDAGDRSRRTSAAARTSASLSRHRVRNGDEERCVTAEGGDIYAITAPIVVEAVERVCAAPRQDAGAFALGQLVDASDFLQTLARTGEIQSLKSSTKISVPSGRTAAPIPTL